MSEPKQSDFVEMREEIVAYLDGELSPEQTAIVESRLATDDGYRHELIQLQRTWDMLDQIPRTTASMDFTRSTVEMAAMKEQKVRRKQWYASLNWRWVAACFAVICCGALGYAISYAGAVKPNKELARDIELLREFELFEEVDSIEYLNRLQLKGLFANEVASLDRPVGESDSNEAGILDDTGMSSNAEAAASTIVDVPSLTTVSIDEMDNGQLYQLKLKKEKFDGLPEDERELYRDLHSRLNAHPKRVLLQQVLIEYNNWLSSVDGKTRAELVQLPLDERVDRVSLIQSRQNQERLELSGDETTLDSDDLNVLAKWTERIGRENRARGYEIFNAFRRKDVSDEIIRKIITDDEIQSLSDSLSEKGRADLKLAIDENRLAAFMRGGLSAARQLRMQVSEEQLQQFFEEKLTANQRSAMDWMEPDVRHRVLKMAYWKFGASDLDADRLEELEKWDPKQWARLTGGRRGPPDGMRGPPDGKRDGRGGDGRGGDSRGGDSRGGDGRGGPGPSDGRGDEGRIEKDRDADESKLKDDDSVERGRSHGSERSGPSDQSAENSDSEDRS